MIDLFSLGKINKAISPITVKRNMIGISKPNVIITPKKTIFIGILKNSKTSHVPGEIVAGPTKTKAYP